MSDADTPKDQPVDAMLKVWGGYIARSAYDSSLPAVSDEDRAVFSEAQDAIKSGDVDGLTGILSSSGDARVDEMLDNLPPR